MEGLNQARRALADATPDTEHDHHGPDPCPVCGGTPNEQPATSWRREPRSILIDESENDEP